MFAYLSISPGRQWPHQDRSYLHSSLSSAPAIACDIYHVLGGSFCFLFIYLFLAVMGLSCSGFISSCAIKVSHCCGFSCCRAQTLGARASVVVVHRLSCSTACGILTDQESNPCLLRWQVDFLPLSYQ